MAAATIQIISRLPASILHKGTNLAGIDQQTGVLTPLFNPRTQDWVDHFILIGVEVHGVTPVGRVTIEVLDMNSSDRLELRLLRRDS